MNSRLVKRRHKYKIGTKVIIKTEGLVSSQAKENAGKMFEISGYYSVSYGSKGDGNWGYYLNQTGSGVWEFEIEPFNEKRIFEF